MHRQKTYNCCSKTEPCIHCSCFDECSAWVNFILLHSDEKTYSHFDKRVSLAMPSIQQYVMDREKIAAHSFYPFIHFTKTMSRFGKKKPKVRELYYCSHLDRCVYQRYAFLINQAYNVRAVRDKISTVSIAYRDNLGKNNVDFAKSAFEAIKSKSHCLIIVGDFTEFFDRLSHQYLKKMLCNLLEEDRLPADYYAIFKNITRFASWDWKLIVEQTGHSITERGVRKKINQQEIIMSKEQFIKNKKSIIKNSKSFGIPQGSPISAVFSNVYMLEFDKIINSYVTSNNGVYMRYSDDFIIVLPYENEQRVKEHEQYIFQNVDSVDGLELQKEKTDIYIYDKGNIYENLSNNKTAIDYLGFVFDGADVKIRPKAITKYYYRMRRKARTIGRSDWQSPNGKHISAKKLYEIYSAGAEKQTFIDYVKRADNILHLKDDEATALVKHHKRKIAQAIKNGGKTQ